MDKQTFIRVAQKRHLFSYVPLAERTIIPKNEAAKTSAFVVLENAWVDARQQARVC